MTEKKKTNPINATITYRELAEIYGYDPVTVSREWKTKGLDIYKPLQEIFLWVTDNILKPLRNNTDLKEQQQIENIRLTKAKADQAELESAVLSGSLISTEYVEQTLTSYFTQLKNILRSIPNNTYIELFASQDPIELRDKLKFKIDQALEDIGNQQYEISDEEDEYEDEEYEEDIEQGTQDDRNEQQEEND